MAHSIREFSLFSILVLASALVLMVVVVVECGIGEACSKEQSLVAWYKLMSDMKDSSFNGFDLSPTGATPTFASGYAVVTNAIQNTEVTHLNDTAITMCYELAAPCPELRKEVSRDMVEIVQGSNLFKERWNVHNDLLGCQKYTRSVYHDSNECQGVTSENSIMRFYCTKWENGNKIHYQRQDDDWTACGNDISSPLPTSATIKIAGDNLEVRIRNLVNTDNVFTNTKDPESCNGRGFCLYPDHCTCNEGYTGRNCETPICYGIPGSNPTVCNFNNGTCVDTDMCNCTGSYTGDQCQYPICFGIPSNDPSVCFYQNGTCILPNTCICNEGYMGLNCEIPICHGIPANDSKVCSYRNGTCVDVDKCICNEGYTGDQCQYPICNDIPSNDPSVCSHQNGTCVLPNTCICNEGYMGLNCEIPICFGIPANESSVCTNNNGSCTRKDNCECYQGFTGDRCQYPVCYGRSSNEPEVCSFQNGTCILPNTCVCNQWYTGLNCEIPICFGIPANESKVCTFGNGTCYLPDLCICNEGYFGIECEVPMCYGIFSNDSAVCNFQNGTCIKHNECLCSDGYVGQECQYPVCFEKNSTDETACTRSNRGQCIVPDRCECFSGYTGIECELNICFGITNDNDSACSSNGNCTAPDTCECNDGYVGNECQFPTCAGKNSTDPTVCTSRGICRSPEVCDCDNWCFIGDYCEFNICEQHNLEAVQNVVTIAYVGQEYHILFELNFTIPLYLQHLVNFSMESNSSQTLIPTVYEQVEGNRNFSCIITNTNVETAAITLVVLNSTITSNSHMIDFVNRSELDYDSNSRRGALYHESFNITLRIQNTFPDASKVRCKQYGTMEMNPTIIIGTSNDFVTYNCTVSTDTPQFIFISLWYLGIPNLQVSINHIPFFFADSGRIEFTKSGEDLNNRNAIYMGTNFTTWIDLHVVKSLPPDRLKCQQNDGILVPVTEIISPSRFACNISDNGFGEGIQYLQLWLDVYNGHILITNNSLPLIFVNKNNILSSNYSVFNIPEARNTSLELQDEIFSFDDNEVKYECEYASKTSAATRIGNRSFVCLIDSQSLDPQVSNITLYLITKSFGTRIPISVNDMTLYFWKELNVTSISPLVITFTSSQIETPLPSELTINVDGHITSNVGFMCKFSNSSGEHLEPAGVNENSVTCIHTAIEQGNNTFHVDVSLVVMNSSHSYFSISGIISIIYMRTPIRFEKTYLFPQDRLKQIGLNVNVPDENTNLELTLTMVPAHFQQLNPSKILSCNFDQYSSPMSCSYGDDLVSTHTPQKFNYELMIRRKFSEDFSVISVEPNFYIENITIIKIFPFLADTSTYKDTPLEIVGSVNSKFLNPFFNYKCIQYRGNGSILNTELSILHSDNDMFSSEIISFGTEELVLIDIEVSIEDFDFQISSTKEGIQFGTFKLVPSVHQMTQQVQSTLGFLQTNAPVEIPPNYQNDTFVLNIIAQQNIVLNCTLSTQLNLQCNSIETNLSQYFNHSIDRSLDILLLSNGDEMTSINHSIGVFTPGEISRVFPSVFLRNLTEQASYLEFEYSNLLDARPNMVYSIYCNVSEIPHQLINAEQISQGIIRCSFDEHYQQYSILNVSTLIKLEDIEPDAYAINSLSSVQRIYFIDKGSISFLSEDQKRLFIGTEEANLKITVQTYIPAIHIKEMVRCSATYRDVKDEMAAVSQLMLPSNDTHVTYSCNFNLRDMVGRVITGLIHMETAIGHETNIIHINSNELDFVVVHRFLMQSIHPVAVRTNTSTIVTITSLFDGNADYGSVEYFCNAEGSEEVMVVAATLENGHHSSTFRCTFFSVQPQVTNVYITMKFGEEEIIITSNNMTISFLDSFFFEPSYGIMEGGEMVFLKSYEGQEMNVFFDEYEAIEFNCTLSTSTLTCITPDLRGSPIKPFSSHLLKIGDRSLAMEYIVYEKQTMTLFPAYIPNDISSVQITIKLQNEITMEEGSAYVKILKPNSQKPQAISLGVFQNQNSSSFILSNIFSDGNYEIDLLYSNINLFETNADIRSIVISNQKKLQIIPRRNISFVQNGNMGYAKSPFNISINLDFDYDIKDKLHCKFGHTFVSTYVIDNHTVSCLIEHHDEDIVPLSIWFVDTHALNGNFQLSSNTLFVVIVSQVTIESIIPYITLNSSANVSLYLNQTALPVVEQFVKYDCDIQGESFHATRNQDVIHCQISKKNDHTQESINIYVSSLLSGERLRYSYNNISFIFSDQISLKEIKPFSISYPKQYKKETGWKYIFSVFTLKKLFTLKDVFLYLETMKNQKLLVPATHLLSDRKELAFEITQMHLSMIEPEPLDELRLRIYINSTQATFFLSENDIHILLVSDSLQFEGSKVINDSSFGSNINLNATTPQNPKFNYTILIQQQDYVNHFTIESIFPCSFQALSKIKCNVSFPLNVYSPIPINFTLIISNTEYSKSANHSIQQLIFIRNGRIGKVDPFLLSHVERQHKPVKVFFDIEGILFNRFQFDFSCHITNKENHYMSRNILESKEGENLSSCMITSFGEKELVFVTVMVHVGGEDFLVTNNKVDIQFTEGPYLDVKRGLKGGNTPVIVDIPSTKNASYELKLLDRNQHHNFKQCHFSTSSQQLSCFSPPMPTNTVNRMVYSIELFANGFRCLLLASNFQYYDVPKLLTILPFPLLDIEYNHLKYQLVFESSLPLSNNVLARYLQDNSTRKGVCNYLSGYILECLVSNTTSFSDITISLSFNERDYTDVPITIAVYNSSAIKINSLFPTEITMGQRVNVTMSGTNFLKTSVTKISLADRGLVIEMKPLISNGTHIVFEAPLMYDEATQFPRYFTPYITFDGIQYVSFDTKLIINGAEKIVIRPLYIPVNTTNIPFTIQNFPHVALKSSHKFIKITLEHVEKKQLFELNCDFQYTSCHLDSPLSQEGEYCANIWTLNEDFELDTLLLNLQVSDRFIAYSEPNFNKIHPSLLVISESSVITLHGSKFPISNQVRLRLESSTSSSREMLHSNDNECTSVELISTYTISMRCSFLLHGNINLLLSFNDGITYHFIPLEIRSIAPYQITSVQNVDDETLPTAFTFRPTSLMIYGTNFPIQEASNIKFRIVSSLFEIILDKQNVEFSLNNTDVILLTLPQLDEYLPSQDIEGFISYPHSVEIGITFNDVYFARRSISLIDQYRAPNILTSDLPAVSLTSFHSVVLRGQFFNDIQNCVINIPNYMNVTSLPRFSEDRNAIICDIPVMEDDVPIHVKTVEVRLQNQRSLSLPYEISVFREPIVVSISPESIPSQGGKVNLRIIRFEPSLFHLFRISVGSLYFDGSSRCIVNTIASEHDDLYDLDCEFPPHEERISMNVTITYNRKTHYLVSNKFSYTGCKNGTYTESYELPCRNCSRGTYKPTIGNFRCFDCLPGEYQEKEGQLQCLSCPRNTTSSPASVSRYDCVCVSGSIVNPRSDRIAPDLSNICIDCPVGAICNGTNVTVPIPKPGYWSPLSDPTNVFVCTPRIACSGGKPENCTEGFTGDRCGHCIEEYFKWRNVCTPCGEYVELRFIVAVATVILFGVLFLAFCSFKVSHISSLSIAFSLWQLVSILNKFPEVELPTEVRTASSAASVTTFNLDFISPSCLIGQIPHALQWASSLSLPIIVLLGFIFAYLMANMRNLFAKCCGKRLFSHVKYMPFIEENIETLWERYNVHKIHMPNQRPDSHISEEQNDILSQNDVQDLKEVGNEKENKLDDILPNGTALGMEGEILNTSNDSLVDHKATHHEKTKSIVTACSRSSKESIQLSIHENVAEKQVNNEPQKQSKFSKLMVKIERNTKNLLIFCRNFALWFVKQELKPYQMSAFRNRLINGYCTFVSFSFVFVMSTLFEIFSCENQADGSLSMKSSPDLLCYQSRSWWIMFGIAIPYVIIYVTIIMAFFIFVFFRKKKLTKKNSIERARYKFIVTKFKSKWYFWEFIITLRKTIVSVSYSIFSPMIAIVITLFAMFICITLHLRAAPYKKKFHNLMEYVMLMGSLVSLMCALLFFFNEFPTENTRSFIRILAISITVSSTIIVFIMGLWDIQTRKKKEKKKMAIRKERVRNEILNLMKQDKDIEHLRRKLQKTKYDEISGDVVFTIPLFEKEEIETEEDKEDYTMNDIIENLFSFRRMKRKIHEIKDANKRAKEKVEYIRKKTSTSFKRRSAVPFPLKKKREK